ncbi:hypothetical protein [Fusobacterium sp. PH5-44]|uniref:RraA family protein n=1 Tax=unclassified Fusobacterium TaxID=2648384 RepID=UPI003D1D50FA
MSVGKRIFLKRKMASKEVMEQLGKIPAANIADVMERSCAMNPRIRLISSPKKPIMVGPAITVKVRAGDNLALHAAMNIAGEGDVIIVSNEGDNTRALMGEIMMTYLHNYKKIAGIILDGPIRDIDEIGKWDFHVYATGTTPGGPYKEGPGEVNVPISCGEISVHPGDIIVADPDGVIVIPQKDAEVILKDAKKVQANDAAKVQASKTGSANRQWVTDLLTAKNFEFIDAEYND